MSDTASNAKNKKENSKCTITLIGQKALRQKHYEKLILDIDYSETLKQNSLIQHKSIVDTNNNIKKTNKIQKYSLISTGLIALMACIFQGLTYCLESNKNKNTILPKTTLNRNQYQWI